MLELLTKLDFFLSQGYLLAVCRIVETRGSTPQKAGALMVVLEDGSQLGTLGGGCVEAEVKRKALELLGKGHAFVETFQLDSDYGWDDGLICGGRMKILIEPMTSINYVEKLLNLVREGKGATEAIVYEDDDFEIPATFLFDAEGECVDALNATTEQAEGAVRHLRNLEQRPRPYLQDGVAYLTVLPRSRLIIVGGGHVGRAVYNLATGLDFDVWIVDDRADYIGEDRFPDAQRRIAGDIDQVLRDIEISPDTFCLIVTRGHNHDQRALYHLADRGARYVGMIGSRRKIRMIFDELQTGGISDDVLRRVHAPVGIEIGSQTVEEIAVSIAAELVSFRNRGEVPGRSPSVFASNSEP